VAALAALPLVPCYLILGPQCTIAILTIVTKKCLFGGKKGVCGFVMEYHPLGSLRSALPARQMTKTLQLQDQFKWALQIVSLLIHLNNSAKIFYPDLRPENLLLNNDNNIVLVDFEQRGGWHPRGPPEVRYLKYLQTLCTPTGNSTSHPIAKYEALLLEHASPELLRSTRSKRYDNPEQGHALPWPLLDAPERESGQVYTLGLLLWCIFEGQNEVANDIFTALPYQTDQEFPQFLHTPMAMRACICECTFGAPQWEHRWPLGTYREGTRVYSRATRVGRASGEETGMAREVFEANQEWWKGQVRRMEEHMDFRRSRKLLADNGSQEGRIRELVDPSGSTRRPTLRQVEEMLKRARNESVITENGTENIEGEKYL
jgi:serine/threonine protein kinase